MTLPPLPSPNIEVISGHREPFVSYDKDQMMEYGQQCYQAAVDKAAAYIDSRYDPCEPWLTPKSFKELMQ